MHLLGCLAIPCTSSATIQELQTPFQSKMIHSFMLELLRESVCGGCEPFLGLHLPGSSLQAAFCSLPALHDPYERAQGLLLRYHVVLAPCCFMRTSQEVARVEEGVLAGGGVIYDIHVQRKVGVTRHSRGWSRDTRACGHLKASTPQSCTLMFYQQRPQPLKQSSACGSFHSLLFFDNFTKGSCP